MGLISIQKKERQFTNKVDPPFLPYIGLFHVAEDNQLDIIGVLLGEEITAERLVQSLTLAMDMHSQMLTIRRVPIKLDSKKIPNFKIREGSEVLRSFKNFILNCKN